MCDFCKTIHEQRVYYSGESYLYKDENKISIIADTYDPLEYGILENVKFCPYCGRKLIKEQANALMVADENSAKQHKIIDKETSSRIDKGYETFISRL